MLLFFISFLIFISLLFFILLMFFIHIFFLTSSLTLPWTMAGFLHPFYTFSQVHRRVIRNTFIFNHSVIFLPRTLRPWVGIFLPTGVFCLTLLHRHFKPAFIKASLGASCSSLKFAGVHADPRNTDPAHLFVWFTVIHNLQIQKNSFLNCIKYYLELLVVKSLVYLLLTCFKLFLLVQSHM